MESVFFVAVATLYIWQRYLEIFRHRRSHSCKQIRSPRNNFKNLKSLFFLLLSQHFAFGKGILKFLDIEGLFLLKWYKNGI